MNAPRPRRSLWQRFWDWLLRRPDLDAEFLETKARVQRKARQLEEKNANGCRRANGRI